MDEKIKLSDILSLCLKCYTEPNNEELIKKVNEICKNFIIRPYLPLIDKQILLFSLLSNLEKAEDFGDSVMRLEIGKVIFGVFGYVLNLENDIDFEKLNYATIDALYELGVVDYIYSFCQADYVRFEKMIDSAISISNIEKLAEVSSDMSDEKIDNLVDTLKEIKAEFTPEMLANLKEITVGNNDDLKDFSKAIGDVVYENAVKKQFRTLDGVEETKEIKKRNTDLKA